MNVALNQPLMSVTALELPARLAAAPAACLIDVRTPVEFHTVHVPGARLLPLDQLNAAMFAHERADNPAPVFVLCHSGGRARRAIGMLQAAGVQDCILVEGGTQPWTDAGLRVERGSSRVLPLMRQVQITVGFISAAGAILALLLNPAFAAIPLAIGCGLLFAGLTGHCGLALFLARMPWNKFTGSCPVSSAK